MPPTVDASRDTSPTYQLANRLLGGRKVLHRVIRDASEAHLRIAEGLPIRALVRLSLDLHAVQTPSLLAALGISQRNFQRRKEAAERDPAAKLSVQEGSRLWQFAEILAQATQTLGSQDAAEAWLSNPHVGLDGRRPIDLLITAQGAVLVSDLLLRMEYGVYT
jgi:putative toxin-antitoxin system antitoxin component (TIGR02293 family)